MINILSYVFIGAGFVFMFSGAVGLFKMKNFYPRVLAASKIDTVGLLTLFIGFMLRHGFTFFTGKLLLIAVLILILNPLVAHIMVRSAYYSGYELDINIESEPMEEGE
jgi:multicomponent Na+:H+ antiporter subunit G